MIPGLRFMLRCCLAFALLDLMILPIGPSLAARPDRILVEVQSEPCNETWNSEAAGLLHAGLDNSVPNYSAGSSLEISPPLFECISGCSKRAAAEASDSDKVATYSQRFILERKSDGTLWLTVESRHGAERAGFKRVQWMIEPTADVDTADSYASSDVARPNDEQRRIMQLLGQYALYRSNEQAGDPDAPYQGLSNTGPNAVPRREKGEIHVIETTNMADQPYSNGNPPQKHFTRATLETVGFLGAAAEYYWLQSSEAKDFDFANFGDSMRARFVTGRAYRFDDNAWDTNMGHVYAGLGYYTLARSNDLNIYESSLFTLVDSSLWEYFVECREVVSINDVIMTPFAGIPIGEVFYQLGEFFQHGSDTVLNKTMGYTFGFPTAFHRWLDDSKSKPARNVDSFGFSTDVWHRFRLSVGFGGSDLASSKKSRGEIALGADLEIVLADKYGRPGLECGFYKNGFFNQLFLNGTFSGDGNVDKQFMARTAFWGYYEQDIKREAVSSPLEGHSLFAGIGTAFEYLSHNFAGVSRQDNLAICDLVGPFLLWDLYRQGVHVRTVTDIYPNFSMVSPFSAREYREDFNAAGATSTFARHGYYYALGLTTGTSLEIMYKKLEFDTRLRFYLFDSINGLDRFQGKLEDDFSLEDKRLAFETGVGYSLPVDNLKVFLNAERLFRWSRIKDFNSEDDETRLLGKLVFEF